MTDLAEPLSTVIDTEPSPSASGGGAVTEPSAPAEPASLRSDLETVFKEDATKEKPEEPVKAEAEKPVAEKPEAEPAKAEEATTPEEAKPEVEKPAAPAKAEGDAEEKSDGTKYQEPPKNFLPDSREHWRNTPRSVRRDIDTLVQTHEAEKARLTEAAQRYDRLRDFDQLAQSNGRDLRESLERVNQLENLMQRSPLAGLNAILMEIGPRKADGQPVSLYEVAQHIIEQGPQGYQQLMAQASQQPQQQQQANPEVETLKSELQAIKEQQLNQSVIEPFKAKHPRFDELKQDIAFFLQSGKIPQTLSHVERLAAAYDMAERINPSSRATQTPTANDDMGPGSDRRADPDFSGSKSIKSSPGSVTEEVEDLASSTESTRDSLLKEMRKLANR